MIILNVTAYQVFIMSFFQLEECVLLESLRKFHPNYSLLGHPYINIISKNKPVPAKNKCPVRAKITV